MKRENNEIDTDHHFLKLIHYSCESEINTFPGSNWKTLSPLSAGYQQLALCELMEQ